jgi:hypothetical protein
LAKEDRVQSRSALLQSAAFNGQFLYTQGNGQGGPRFIANNNVHEYISQVDATQTFSLGSAADYRRTVAMAAIGEIKRCATKE